MPSLPQTVPGEEIHAFSSLVEVVRVGWVTETVNSLPSNPLNITLYHSTMDVRSRYFLRVTCVSSSKYTPEEPTACKRTAPPDACVAVIRSDSVGSNSNGMLFE